MAAVEPVVVFDEINRTFKFCPCTLSNGADLWVKLKQCAGWQEWPHHIILKPYQHEWSTLPIDIQHQ